MYVYDKVKVMIVLKKVLVFEIYIFPDILLIIYPPFDTI